MVFKLIIFFYFKQYQFLQIMKILTNVLYVKKYNVHFRLLKTPEEVLKAGKYMVACQLSREPLIRKCLRETFFDRAKINIVPTKRGLKEIDENHNCYS